MLLHVSESISESEEQSKQNQQKGRETPSPGNEENQGTCGTPADEKPGNCNDWQINQTFLRQPRVVFAMAFLKDQVLSFGHIKPNSNNTITQSHRSENIYPVTMSRIRQSDAIF